MNIEAIQQIEIAQPVLRCSKCHGERDTVGRYCRKCRADYMREYRVRVKQHVADLKLHIADLLKAV